MLRPHKLLWAGYWQKNLRFSNSGTTKRHRVTENIGGASVGLSSSDVASIDEAFAKPMRKATAIQLIYKTRCADKQLTKNNIRRSFLRKGATLSSSMVLSPVAGLAQTS